MIWTGIVRALWKPVAALLALLGVYLAGKRHARQQAKSEALQDYAKTMEKAHEAPVHVDADAARRGMRDRDPKRR
jgi:hypothetical protein